MAAPLVIGTRGSRLARAQTDAVARALRAAWPDLDVRVEVVRTTGDRQAAVPLDRLGGQGAFVKELERALLDGAVDLAVHSLKDVPTRLPDGLTVAGAVPPRADPRDALVTPGGSGLDALPAEARVATGSPRRRAMLRRARPDLVTCPVRGNVDTRLARLAEGDCDALVLAAAGLARLGLARGQACPLGTDLVLPAAGQGALGLEHRADDARVRGLAAVLDDAPSRQAVTAERAAVRRLGAGCSTPLGVLGAVGADGRLRLEAWLLAPDGAEALRARRDGPAGEAEALGTVLAERLLADGAKTLMNL